MILPTKADAIIALVGGQITLGSDGSNAVYHDGQTPPTEAEIKTKFAEIKAEYDAQEYARSRKTDYPEIGDQLDALYHAGVFPANMAARIKETKDKYPKG
jgi:hypothetical protein